MGSGGSTVGTELAPPSRFGSQPSAGGGWIISGISTMLKSLTPNRKELETDRAVSPNSPGQGLDQSSGQPQSSEDHQASGQWGLPGLGQP